MNRRAFNSEFRKRFLGYEPHEKQSLFHSLGLVAKERCFFGGNRTGKTVGGTTEVAMHLTGNYPAIWNGLRFDRPIHAWAASDTTETTRDILQKAYLGDEESGRPGLIIPDLVVSKTMRRGVADAVDTVYIRHATGGTSVLQFKSYDQRRKKFQGASLDIVHLDEEPPQDIYDECLLRVFDRSGYIILTMTPLNGMTEVCLSFLDNRLPGVVQDGRVYVNATWDDNPHLSPIEKERLRATLAPHELEARERGIPTLGGGKVYPVREDSIVIDPFPIPKHWRCIFGLDFGWRCTAAPFFAHDTDSDTVYLIGEYADGEKTPELHSGIIRGISGGWMPGVYDPAGDNSNQIDGEKIAQKYRDSGFILYKADNSVEAGIQEVLTRMQSGRFKVFRTCEKWLAEFRVYARDKNTGVPMKKNDHLMDGTRYVINKGLRYAVSHYMAHNSTHSSSSNSSGAWGL